MGKFIARWFVRINGWEPEGKRPAARKFVLLAAPHTSNWDLAYLLALATVLDVRVSWIGKHTLFLGPMGPIMRWLGGISIDRRKRSNMVAQMAEAFSKTDALALTIPPEGTRSLAPHWKSGFYHIAREAKVPIVLGFLDYARKRGGFGPEIIPTGDVRADMDKIRAFYDGIQARYPKKFGPVRLKEEDQPANEAG